MVALAVVTALVITAASSEAKPKEKNKRRATKVQTTKRITDSKTAHTTNAMTSEHVDIKVTPPGPHGKPGVVIVEVYNRSKLYLETVRFELELDNNGWDRLSQTITVDAMEAGGSTVRELKIPGETSKSAASSIKDVQIKRMEMYSNDATLVRLNYNLDLIVR
jgi:hypothetical protein